MNRRESSLTETYCESLYLGLLPFRAWEQFERNQLEKHGIDSMASALQFAFSARVHYSRSNQYCHLFAFSKI
jgi:hypothetical protein